MLAQPVTFSSGNDRVRMVELYTSEGCSSCPPADKWLSQYKNDDRLWQEIIPLAFHVDYWNYIGWKDRFSSSAYTQRQYSYAQHKNISSVYTPGVVLDGKEWRGWYRNKAIKTGKESAGNLHISLENNLLAAKYSHQKISTEKLYLNIAILGFDLITHVQAGENNGQALEHDFVVIGYKRLPLEQVNNHYAISSALPNSNIQVTRKGLAVWIDSGTDLMPIQATGGWLNKF